jgi:fructan beta-fructosidase
MKIRKITALFCCSLLLIAGHLSGQQSAKMKEQFRPQFHFSPQKNWMNDPNGMVYHKGIYHLFFQYNPYSSVWGPMHWGHATSKDLIHWQQQPIAIYPDKAGTIFSGSAVADKNNTSGFGKKGQVPLVAIFTQHDTLGEKAGKNDFQNQCIAYSLDDGKTWTKYSGNPVVKNPGTRDFRDPKVMWFEPQKKWIMTLAVRDVVSFYSSPDLKNWTKESDFGKEAGAHGGGWECPDLFELKDNDGGPGEKKSRWVLIVSLNPGGPNGGSATQYFIGNFDGKNFTTDQQDTRWLDYGPDNYAGITWSNTGERKILLGWMTNWLYANEVPTEKWRSAMTIPRELKLKHVGENIFLTSKPVTELAGIQLKPVAIYDTTAKIKLPCRLDLSLIKNSSFSLELSNAANEKLVIGYDKNLNQYFIDRSASGKVDFNKAFAAKHFAPRLTDKATMSISILVDESSVELFADDGLTVMTSVCFPSTPYNAIHLPVNAKKIFTTIKYTALKSIW